jgi:hypothetical protein
MRSFIPESVNVVAHTLYDTSLDSVRFLHDTIEITDDILVIIDEDFFITNWVAVEDICQYVKDNDIIFSGIPDGGEILHRCFSWCTANPFFVIFNCKLINKKKKTLSRSIIDWHGYNPSIEHYKPDFLTGNFNHGSHEPFNGLFYWLLTIGKPFYIKGATIGDGITTEVKGIGDKIIGYHTWYSRDLGEGNQARIEHIFQLAKKNKVNE